MNEKKKRRNSFKKTWKKSQEKKREKIEEKKNQSFFLSQSPPAVSPPHASFSPSLTNHLDSVGRSFEKTKRVAEIEAKADGHPIPLMTAYDGRWQNQPAPAAVSNKRNTAEEEEFSDDNTSRFRQCVTPNESADLAKEKFLLDGLKVQKNRRGWLKNRI